MARNEDGTYAADHDADADAVLDFMQPGMAYTTGEVALAVDAPRRTVYEYLMGLHRDGAVTTRRPNERLRLWSLAEARSEGER